MITPLIHGLVGNLLHVRVQALIPTVGLAKIACRYDCEQLP